METRISAHVVKEKSYDPNFIVNVSYDDGNIRFSNELITVLRKPPKVNIEYSEHIKQIMGEIDIAKIELEVMKAIVEYLLSYLGDRR